MMILFGTRTIVKKFKLKKAGHYYACEYKNCLLLVYVKTDMKVVKITFPFIKEKDRLAVHDILSRYDFITSRWIYNKLVIQFSERVWFYPTEDIIAVISSIVDYSEEQYPSSMPVCEVCKMAKKTDVYYTPCQVLSVCDTCASRFEKRLFARRNCQSAKGFYRSGLFGAALYSCFGIMLSILCYNLFFDIGLLAAACYYSLARRGYERFNGKASVFGICIVYTVGLISSACGSLFAYVSSLFIQSLGFDRVLAVLPQESDQSHLLLLVILSMFIYSVFGFYHIVRSIPYMLKIALKRAFYNK